MTATQFNALDSKAAREIRAVLLGPLRGDALYEALYNKLNYQSYDLEFFAKLAKEFNIDMSDFLSSRRITRKDAIHFFITNIVN